MATLQKLIYALGALFISSTIAVSPLEVKGADFVNSVDGSRFQILGVAYQPGGSSGFNPGSGIDPLSNGTTCLRDATLIQRLGANAIRVYNLDPDLDHSECASIFNAAGIYMILDVNSPLPNQSLNRGAPWDSYNYDYLNRVFQVVQAFMNFPNTLGFFSGNEVINQDSVAQVPAYIRAVTRDIKDYIAKQAPRSIPVGYSAADVDTMLTSTWNYLSCQLDSDTSSKIDFFGLNSYSWCGQSTFVQSGYSTLIQEFGNTTIPLFFSEYGCNLVSPRTFSEVPTIYGPQMTGVLSGGIVYEFNQEVNNYGLVENNDNGTLSILPDYNALQGQYNSLNIKELTASNSTATSLTPETCSPALVTISNFDNTYNLPTRPDGVDQLISQGIANKNSYPSGPATITHTAVKEIVYDANGEEISGLELNVLQSDQSNLPGGNTSGTEASSTASSGTPTATASSSSPSKTGAAVKPVEVNAGSLVMGVLTLGFLLQM